jgi:hypothetical protein
MGYYPIREAVEMTRFPILWDMRSDWNDGKTAYVIGQSDYKSSTAPVEYVVWTAHLSDSGICNLTGGRYYSDYRLAQAEMARRANR